MMAITVMTSWAEEQQQLGAVAGFTASFLPPAWNDAIEKIVAHTCMGSQ